MNAVVHLSVEAGIATVSLNRPEKLNAINRELIRGLRDALAAALADDRVRVILLCGEGRAFCAGNDLEATAAEAAGGFTRGDLEEHAAELQDITRHLCFGDRPVVGAIHGWAVGAGFEWALNCDFTVWGESARAFLPEIQLGVYPTGGALALLPRIVGLNKAREMFLLGERYGARELETLGLTTRVVPDAQVREEAQRLARRCLELPPQGVARLKRGLLETLHLDLEQTLQYEAAALVASVLCAPPQEAPSVPDENS